MNAMGQFDNLPLWISLPLVVVLAVFPLWLYRTLLGSDSPAESSVPSHADTVASTGTTTSLTQHQRTTRRRPAFVGPVLLSAGWIGSGHADACGQGPGCRQGSIGVPPGRSLSVLIVNLTLNTGTPDIAFAPDGTTLPVGSNNGS